MNYCTRQRWCIANREISQCRAKRTGYEKQHPIHTCTNQTCCRKQKERKTERKRKEEYARIFANHPLRLSGCASLFSFDKLLEVLGNVSAALTAPEAGEGGDGHPALPSEYWDLVRARGFSSVLGIVVGVLGIRGSHSLSTQTIQIYYVGLVMCAIVAMVIRIGVLIDIIADKVGVLC